MSDERPAKSRRERPRQRREPKPLDAATLQDMALNYAARYATTGAKLARYLARKLKERGWSGDTPPDLPALVGRLAELRYVDDRIYAGAKAREMAARGLGRRRVSAALQAAGVPEDDRAAILDDQPPDAGLATAIAYARRRRLGPFARERSNDPARRQKELAAMLRAGHAFDIARRVLAATDEAAAEALVEE